MSLNLAACIDWLFEAEDEEFAEADRHPTEPISSGWRKFSAEQPEHGGAPGRLSKATEHNSGQRAQMVEATDDGCSILAEPAPHIGREHIENHFRDRGVR